MEEDARSIKGHSPSGYHEQDQGQGWRLVLRFGASAALLALFWWILSNGNLESWTIGGPAVLLGTGSSLLLSHRVKHQLRLTGLIGFAPFFFWRSLCGSIDVARRALHPKMPLEPAFLDYNLSLPNGAPRLFMANVVSLLPGTLSAELLEGCLKVHVLDVKADVVAELQSLESRVAAVFAPKPPRSVVLGE